MTRFLIQLSLTTGRPPILDPFLIVKSLDPTKWEITKLPRFFADPDVPGVIYEQRSLQIPPIAWKTF